MTSLTGPLNIYREDDSVSAATSAPVVLKSEGSASFGADLHVGGSIDVSGDLSVSGNATFGAGNGVLYQSVTIAANLSAALSGGTQAFSVPTGSRILDLTVDKLTDVCADTDLTITIGTSGDTNEYATMAVSGSTGPMKTGLFNSQATGVCAKNLNNASNGVFITIAHTSGSAAEELLFGVEYIRR